MHQVAALEIDAASFGHDLEAHAADFRSSTPPIHRSSARSPGQSDKLACEGTTAGRCDLRGGVPDPTGGEPGRALMCTRTQLAQGTRGMPDGGTRGRGVSKRPLPRCPAVVSTAHPMPLSNCAWMQRPGTSDAHSPRIARLLSNRKQMQDPSATSPGMIHRLEHS